MTPPALVFILTFACCLLIGAHSVWRFVVRTQIPSLVHASSAAWMTYAAWLVFLGDAAEDPMRPIPKTPALMMLGCAVISVAAIHFYELRAREPYDGLFPWLRRKRKPK